MSFNATPTSMKEAFPDWSKADREAHDVSKMQYSFYRYRDTDEYGKAFQGFRFHHTDVVRSYPEHVEIDLVRWDTTTTRSKINNALAEAQSTARVYRNRGVTYVKVDGVEFQPREIEKIPRDGKARFEWLKQRGDIEAGQLLQASVHHP